MCWVRSFDVCPGRIRSTRRLLSSSQNLWLLNLTTVATDKQAAEPNNERSRDQEETEERTLVQVFVGTTDSISVQMVSAQIAHYQESNQGKRSKLTP